MHIRDFGAIGRQPRTGDVLRYQVMADGTGRLRAGDVEVAGLPRRISKTRTTRTRRTEGGRTSRFRVGFLAVGLLSLAGLGAYEVGIFAPRSSAFESSTASSESSTASRLHSPWTSHYECQGKKYCSEMESCEEAIFYLQSCPDTKMDGDGDGVPCERQWC